jgi:hypothetical protein
MSVPEIRREVDAIDALTNNLRLVVDELVNREIERGAALYVREKHLQALLGPCWRDMSDGEIVIELERKVGAAAAMLAGGHWASDTNRLIALRQALAAERRK